MPIEKLTSILVRVIIICEPVDTAETSVFSANCPTTSRSTAPYIACKNIASRTGSMNLSSFESIAPLVKSLLFIFYLHVFIVKTATKDGLDFLLILGISEHFLVYEPFVFPFLAHFFAACKSYDAYAAAHIIEPFALENIAVF